MHVCCRRIVRVGFLAACALAALGGCARPIVRAPLATVAPLPLPSLPPWIEQISPTGTAGPLAQIRVIFAHPLLPVGEIGTPGERALLADFEIAPALPGRFVVLTPRMIGFEAAAALPEATRVRVTLKSGLRDLRGDALARDLAWTFVTRPLKIVDADAEAALEETYGPATPPPAPVVSLRPMVRLESNVRLDPASLARFATFQAPGNAPPIGAAVAVEPQATAPPGFGAAARFNPALRTYIYDVTPQQALAKATNYAFVVDPGVRPAYGNLPSTTPFRKSLTTYGPLALVQALATTDPMIPEGAARFANGDPALVFDNQLDPKSFAQNVTLSPPGRPVPKRYSLSYDGDTIYVNPFALAPDTRYTVTIAGAMQDVYGQQLGLATATTFRTGDLAPYFWAPAGLNRFVAGERLQLQYKAANLPGNRYQAAYETVDPRQLVYSSAPQPADWKWYRVAGAVRNVESRVDVPLSSLLGGAFGTLAYGVGAQIPGTSPTYGLVQLTDLGVFAQWFPRSGEVSVQRLSDGAPVVGARVDVYVSHAYEQRQPGSPSPCASGTTDAAGRWSVRGVALETCYAGDRPADEAPELLAVVRDGRDWSYVRTYDWSGIYDYDGITGGWSDGQPISRGTLYSDREMYQPGERAWLTAVCYVLQDGKLSADRDARYALKLTDPNGKDVSLPSQTTNRYATFSFPIDLAKTQELGYYTVTATGPQGARITGSFRVAEFHPPNFSVDLTLDRSVAASGETVQAKGRARYLFGAPMNGAKAMLHVTRQPISFTPPGWAEYAFGRQWLWPQEEPSVTSDVTQQSVVLDAQGKARTAIAVDSKLPYPMAYRVDLQVSDASNLESSATASFSALPSSSLVGLRNDFVGSVGVPVNVDVIVTDPQGHAESGKAVHLELQQMRYGSVTQIVEGSQAALNSVRFVTVSQADATSAGTPQRVQLTASAPGSYRIRAEISGTGAAAATDSPIWISGPGQAVWGQSNPSQLEMKLDKAAYHVGDTAKLAVASPYRRADLYLSVVRDRVLYKRTIAIDGSAPDVRIPITQAMFPNAAVEAELVRRGPPLTQSNVRGVDSLVRIGMVPLALDLSARYLSASVVPNKATLAPGGVQRVRLTLRDGRGRPVRGQFTVIVANDAILRLSGYRPPDLVKTVFAAQPISTRFADNRPNVTLAQPTDATEKGWGYGGGFLAGAAGTHVRTKFVPLAYFNGSVRTGADGSAEVSFKVPDDLTTWRVMAVAATDAAEPRFANADATFVTSKPLVTDALLPQFARTGDRIDAGLALMNLLGTPVDATTHGTLTGGLTFASSSSQSLDARASFGAGMNAWRFPILVGAPSPSSVEFQTSIGKGVEDAFRVPFEIRNAGVRESTIDAGATSGRAQIPLAFGQAPGTLTISVAGSLLPEIAVPAERALGAERLALLLPTAGRLSIATSLVVLERRIGHPLTAHDARSEAIAAVAGLAALQRLDGGFAFWPNGHSDAFGSADAVRSLAYARDHGIPVPVAVLANAKPYLVRALADPHAAERWCDTAACKASLRLAMLQALAALGDRRTDFLQAIYAQRGALGLGARAQLARYLQETPGWRMQADTLARELAQKIYVTGRYANIQSQSAWYYSEVGAQAAYVRLLVARRAPAERTDRAIRALVAQSCRCGWPSAADTAAALRAMVDYAATERTAPDFTANLTLDGKNIGTARFAGYGAAERTFTVDTRNFATGSHALVLSKVGAGTLHYVVSYAYRLDAGAPGALHGLRVVRVLRAVDTTPVLATFDLAPQTQTLSFAANEVFDVGVRVIVDHPVDRVVVSDPLPAGFEALHTSFQTTAAYYQPLADSWQIDYQQIYRDRVVAFARHLDPGVYSLHYLVRSVTPGTYLWPGAQVYLLDAPEEFGRTAFATVRVRE